MKLVRGAPLFVLAYGAVCLMIPSCVSLADRLVLYPQAAVGAEAPAVRHLVQGVELWQVPHPAPKAFALRFYGNADLADHWVVSEAAAYAAQGIELWGVNYPGYGGSTGPASLAGVAHASELAYDFVRARVGDAPIGVIGTSLGTTAALHVTAERPAAFAVLVNPPALRELIVGEFGWWNFWILAKRVAGQIPDGLDSVANARRSRAPAVFVTSTRDEVVPIKYQSMVFEAYGGDKSVINRAEAQHNTPLDTDVRNRLHEAVARALR